MVVVIVCGGGIYIYIHRYEHEAILKPKTENNIGAPSAPQKFVIIFLITFGCTCMLFELF